MPRVSPRPRVKLTPRTARPSPSSVGKVTASPAAESTAASAAVTSSVTSVPPLGRVKGVPQAVTDEIHDEDGQHEERRGEGEQPRQGGRGALAGGDERAEVDLRRRGA